MRAEWVVLGGASGRLYVQRGNDWDRDGIIESICAIDWHKRIEVAPGVDIPSSCDPKTPAEKKMEFPTDLSPFLRNSEGILT
jgi:hypothetical protein